VIDSVELTRSGANHGSSRSRLVPPGKNGLHVSNQRTMQNLCRDLNLRYFRYLRYFLDPCVRRRSHESHAMRRTVARVERG